MLDAASVLAAYDAQIRRSLEPPIGTWTIERVGAVVRGTAPASSHQGGFILYTDLDADTVDAAIVEQLAFFRADGRRSEWKVYGHDQPADLPDRLSVAGLVPEEFEALVVGEVDGVLAALERSPEPAGVVLREANLAVDLDGIIAMHEAVWGADYGWMRADLADEKAGNPDGIFIYVAADETTGEIVSSGWLRPERGTDFAGLWGGSTLAAYRGRGIYKALVKVRTELARDLGFRYVQVDASPDSEPILRRLGLEKLTWTRPYIWLPPT